MDNKVVVYDLMIVINNFYCNQIENTNSKLQPLVAYANLLLTVRIVMEVT